MEKRNKKKTPRMECFLPHISRILYSPSVALGTLTTIYLGPWLPSDSSGSFLVHTQSVRAWNTTLHQSRDFAVSPQRYHWIFPLYLVLLHLVLGMILLLGKIASLFALLGVTRRVLPATLLLYDSDR